ncbi:uncharacterized protein DMAD_01928 [Drosophila madeirensis]|uniref:HMG box domain-containing protein n=1 Tax=Drosophila madeirensis TaxID=30013 RepID=A0AAU9G1V2_DROMD
MNKEMEMGDRSENPSTSKEKHKLEKQPEGPTPLAPYKKFIEKYRKTVPEKSESEQFHEATSVWSSMSLEERKTFCYAEDQLKDEAKTEGNEAKQNVKKVQKSCVVS